MVADGNVSKTPTRPIHRQPESPDPAGDPKRSVYVLDTSVLVHDPTALHAFRNTTVALPIYVVMELDELKNSKRHDVAASARVASRMISELRALGKLSSPEGVFHEDLGTTFRVITDDDGKPSDLPAAPTRRSMDMRILASASRLAASSGQFGRVTLVTKDVNLRIFADIEGIVAEDYHRDRVALDDLPHGYRIVEDFPPGLERNAYIPGATLHPEEVGVDNLAPREFIVLRRGETDVVLRCCNEDGHLIPVARDFPLLADIQPRNTEQRMALDLLLDSEVELITLVGKAGTGKTFLALAAALAQLREERSGTGYDRILLSKPVVSMGGDIGYLPGDLEAKLQPWMTSFFDNLDQLIPGNSAATDKGANRTTKGWEYLFQTGQLEMQPIHSIRGRSIPAAFMLIDEAQNLTPHEVKTIITRAANGTKVVLCGDPYQVDNQFLDQHSNGLVHVTERLRDSKFTGTVFFTRGERSRLAELAATRL
jgi:PhoH-like ATPase